MSEERLNRFKDYCQKWQVLWGLQDWLIAYAARKLPKDVYARVTCDNTARIATMVLTTVTIGDDDMEWFAIHEMLHLFYADNNAMLSEYFNSEKVLALEHEMINRQLNIIEAVSKHGVYGKQDK